MQHSGSAARWGLGMGTAFAVVAWLTLSPLTYGPRQQEAPEVLRFFGAWGSLVTPVLLLAIGAIGAWKAASRSVLDAAAAGAVAGLAASIPVYVFVGAPGFIVAGVAQVIGLTVLVDAPPSRETATDMLLASIQTAYWVTPLWAAAGAAALILIGALCGVGYLGGSRLAGRIRSRRDAAHLTSPSLADQGK